MTRPRWWDPRILAGLLLVVGSVVLGAKVVGAADRTAPVWSVTRDLATGTVLTAEDLAVVRVKLDDTADRYLAGAAPPVGLALTRPVDVGELLPASAVRPAPDHRVLVFGVTPEDMPPGVGHGSVVDLYLEVAGRSGERATTDLLAAGVTVQSVAGPASGGLSGAATDDYQVAVALPPAAADDLIRALPTGTVRLLVRSAP
ncbi:flagellar biosynthesis protein FlgA [Nakamurella sp. YIM 132087]|uniref:Flagellar biosynthesis protein FlgA n=1 Tax=Nakamurella alba TaxID=2665158 RepID=A0A7K1FHQ7_9ACTN|nr:SAF domain-containing protein [Nakamurella alba]MTD12979.1 flagellar biosynthesis protein FlgA [Nakamurella alba]